MMTKPGTHPLAPTAPSHLPAAPTALLAAPYRPFFLAAIVIGLTIGATAGVWLLFQVRTQWSFTAVPIHPINAHGQAQLFGWLGLFIMGLGYQLLPVLWRSALPWPRLALLVLALMVIGLLMRAAGMGFLEGAPVMVWVALAGGLMQSAAIAIFVVQMVLTLRRGHSRLEPWAGFIVAALGLMFVQAVFSTWHTWNTMTAPTRELMLSLLATWQAPLRDVQLRGMALLMLLGVSMWLLPAMFGQRPVSRRRGWAALLVLLSALAVSVTAFVGWRLTGARSGTGLLYLSWIAMIVGVCLVALPWRLWRPMPVADRSGKFIRAAYGWLAVSLLMLLALPVYQAMADTGFSHAYYGAIRHAITVGFISMMLMGLGAKLVPLWRGVEPHGLSPLWGPFILINLGCLLRISMQTASDFVPAAFAIIGFSGVLEMAALGWWGSHLAYLMLHPRYSTAGVNARPCAAQHRSPLSSGDWPSPAAPYGPAGG